MDAALLEELRAKLLELKASLEEIAEASEEASRPVELDQSKVGRISRMDAMRAQSMALEAERRRKDQVRAIAAALRRIESGDYGECEECGEDISAGRLRANPAATHCISCADAVQRQD